MLKSTQLISALVISIFLAVSAQPTWAELSNFSPNLVLGDGKDGNVWQQWKQNISESPIQSIIAKIQRVSGGNDTFVNLRFGNGSTLENGKQVFLTDNSIKTVSWQLSGSKPNNQPLVMNAYKGNVKLLSVNVNYLNQVDARSDNVRIPPLNQRPPHEGRPMHGPNSPVAIGDANNQQVVRRCQRSYVQEPKIEIGEVRASGGLFSGKHRINGSVRGTCIEEAGYYERGTLKEKFDIALSDRFGRSEFSIRVRGGRGGEIRSYTTQGHEAVVSVDELLRDYNQQSPF